MSMGIGSAQVTKDKTGAGAGDNLGNHTATQALNMATFDINNAGALEVEDEISLQGDLTPAQITADQNDYNPTNLADASVLRLDTNARRTITGLAGGADGRMIFIHNIGAFIIRLTSEDAASTAANRFAFGIEQWLYPNDCIELWYDSTSSRWRALRDTNTLVIVKPADETVNNSTTLQDDDDFKFAAAVNAVYYTKMSGRIDVKAASDYKYNCSTPTGAIMRGASYWAWPNGASNVTEATLENTTIAKTVTSALIYMTGNEALVIMSSTAGNVVYQWAQNTAVAENTIVKKGSVWMIRRVI